MKRLLLLCLVSFAAFGTISHRDINLARSVLDGNLKGVISSIHSGANVNLREPEEGTTILQLAVYKELVEIAQHLINAGAQVNAQAFNGARAIHMAVIKGNTDMLCLLLKNGANSNYGGAGGITALHLAAGMGKKELVKILLEKGANIHAYLPILGTPAQLAIKKGYPEIAQFIRSYRK